MTFLRLGWSEGSAPLHNRSVTAGFIHSIERRSDLMGIGVNWGDPSDDSLRDQLTLEGFYRFQLAKNLAITPSVQLLHHPALNDEVDDIWLFGLRARFTF